MKKAMIISILLLSIMFFSSCASSDVKIDVTDNASVGVTTGDAVNFDDSIEVMSKIDFVDCEGHEFIFSTRRENNPEWDIWALRDIDAKVESGEPINDAVFIRNRYIEEKFNCTITDVQSYNQQDDINKTIMSGENNYDVIINRIGNALTFASNGYFYDLNTLESIHLDNPWWDKGANDAFNIIGKLFTTSGDLIIINNDAIGAFVFNKGMADDYGISSLYDEVKNGSWTYDKFDTIIKGISHDVNGDSKMDSNDCYGGMIYTDAIYCMIHGGGTDFVIKDADGIPQMNVLDEKTISVVDRVFTILGNSDYVYSLRDSYKDGVKDAFKLGTQIFQDSRAFIYWIRLRDVEALRTMETDFGILPIPKFDEMQENYRSTVNYATACTIGIPISNPDAETTAALLEAMSAKSHYTLQKAYYDVTLQGKFMRDEESSKMLDILFMNRVYDLGIIANFGGMQSQIDGLFDRDENTYVSMFEKYMSKAEKEIYMFVKNFEKL